MARAHPATQGRRLRILMAKAGLDGHDRGVKVVARALRDAGFEVIYTGLHQTPEQVVRAAVDEDVDAIGLSLLSGAHMTLFPRILELLRQEGASDIILFGGGTIPEDDVRTLKQMGVTELFTPGASTIDIVEWVRANVAYASRPNARISTSSGSDTNDPTTTTRAGAIDR